MDKQMKARRPVRGQVTRLVREVNELLAVDPAQENAVRVKFTVLTATMETLREMDSAVINVMLEENLTDEEQDAEYDSIMKYKELFEETKLKVETLLRNRDVPPDVDVDSISSVGGTRKKRNFKYPKIELQTFDGDLKSWLGWWSHFKKIHEDSDLDNSDKFTYLFQAMKEGSEAKELISSYPQTAENYTLAVEALKDRFGRKDLLLQVYVRELLTLVISNVTNKEKIQLSSLYIKLESHLRSLATLELDKTLLAIVLFPLVESSLSVECLRAWQRSPVSKLEGSKMNPPKSRLDLLMEFIKAEVQSEQQISLAQSTFTSAPSTEGKKFTKQKRTRYEDEVPTAAGLVSTTQKGGCVFCGRSHDSDRCVTALSMDLEARKKIVKDKRLCFRCLKAGHISKKCKAVVQCALCNGKHYPIICTGIPGEKDDKKTKLSERNAKDEDTSTTMSNAVNHCSSEVLLYSLCVDLVGDGVTVKARILGDPGSQRSYIRKSIAHEAKCKKVGEEWLRNIVFGGGCTKPRKVNKVSVSLRSPNGKQKKTLQLLEEEDICGKTPKVPRGKWVDELATMGIALSDVGVGYQDVDILIGFDYWGEILTGEMKKLPGGLIATETIFGWTLGGPLPKPTTNATLVTTSLVSTVTDISNLWSLEAIGIRDPIEVKTEEEQERAAMKHFEKTVTRDNEGWYVVSLPWADSDDGKAPELLPTNRTIAEQRLKSVTRKLLKNKRIEDYDNVFKSWEKEGLIKLVADTDNGHFIPHRPVFKESVTTPVRPVYDASCRVGRFPSINDRLYKGPNLLELIPTLLIRFREKRIGVSADIRKAFQMVKVKDEDQIFQKFLWWSDLQQSKMKVYQHTRVVFGMTCSPFILGAVINHHLKQYEDTSDSSVAERLTRSFYVDNCVLSVDNMEEYRHFRERSVDIMGSARMELRQWAHSLTDEFRINQNEQCGLNSDEMRIMMLGLVWNRENDTLSCEVKDMESTGGNTTKRAVLSIVSRIFDPIGFLSPTLLIPKLLLQESWLAKVGWDDPLPTSMQERFSSWQNGLHSLQDIQLPRHFQQVGTTKMEVHIFCDSSIASYATVIYIRTEATAGVQVSLVLAKSRVAPVKKASIPRLELLACVLGVRQAQIVKKALNLEDIPFYYWSDSSTALAWIRRNGVWGVFVQRRVDEIRLSTMDEQWHHVAGVNNPADLPSRGCSPKQLLASSWWEGPSWLKLPHSEWPSSQVSVNENEVNQERRVTSLAAAVTVNPSQPVFNSYQKNVSVWGWVFRFIDRCRGKKIRDSQLTVMEMRRAEKVLLRQIQKESFPADPVSINGIRVSKGSDDLIRVKTRLFNRMDRGDFIMPILLPKDHPQVSLLIQDAHRTFCHAGVQCLMSKLREKYWILQSRRAVRKAIRKCVVCRRHEAPAADVDPASLPERRVKMGEAFETVGVDLCGPLIIKDGSKAWIVLFTCAVYRGVYLDLVASLSTEAFLGALERFIGLYGRPNTIYSDNGTNFVGAENLFKTLDWKKIEEETNLKKIQWIFNPPTAAWWGGWWERLVRSVKGLLKRMLGKSRISFEELRTCLAGVAATINDRPLTVITEDNEDLIPLTPNMFIRGKAAGFLPETEDGEALSHSYKKMKRYQDQIHSRFRKEYLSQLVMRGNERKQSITVGDVVLVGADNKKRFEWPLGVIVELLRGKDGCARVAKVKTQSGVMLRPLQRLYPLEIPRSSSVPEAMKKAEVRTKSGRSVKGPSKYGQWLHLIL